MKYSTDIKMFVKIFSLFLVPVAVLTGVAIFFAVYAGEIQPLRRVVDKQAEGGAEYVFARQIIERETVKYKYLSVMRQRPEILAVGSSRVLELRKEMFGKGSVFYNAGSMASSLMDLVDFVNALPQEYAPEVIIVGIDTWWFDVQYLRHRGFTDALSAPEEVYNWRAYLYASRYVLSRLIIHPTYAFTLIKGIDPFGGGRAVGIDAIEHGNGFRNDGSRQYAGYISEMRRDMTYVDREVPPIIERVREGYDPFSFGSSFAEAGPAILDEFLTLARARGITVVGIAPPFSTEVYAAMSNSHYASFLQSFKQNVAVVFASHDIHYFDFSDLKSVGIQDVYMLDGEHPTETGVALMLMDVWKETCPEGIFKNCNEMQEELAKKVADHQTTPAEIAW